MTLDPTIIRLINLFLIIDFYLIFELILNLLNFNKFLSGYHR